MGDSKRNLPEKTIEIQASKSEVFCMKREQLVRSWLIESMDSEPTVDGVLLYQEREGELVFSLRTLKDYLEYGT